MGGTYLLDTNAAIALVALDNHLAQLLNDADDVFASTITLGEMYFGAEKSARVGENQATVDRLVESIVVLSPDATSARLFGKAKQRLRVKGRPIPDHDIWIAVLAMQHTLTLLTRDAHFNEVEGLTLAGW
jgi:tRNA(fMet)-specific endonuclease VapC